jgi:hypothetical protein
MKPETKGQSKQWDAYTFTKLRDKVYTNVVCLKADGNCFLA